MKTRVLIADDHPIFRQGLVAVLRETEEFELVGEAEDGRKALELLESLRPDVAVIDIGMPMMDGLQVIRSAGERCLESAFVVLTMYKDEEYLREALSLGVKGFLLKESASSELLHCLRSVLSGKRFVSSEYSDFLLSRSSASDAEGRPVNQIALLSPTEHRILRMLAENKTSREIADELHISFRTVNNHRAHICEKLHLEGHNRLLQFAIEHRSLL